MGRHPVDADPDPDPTFHFDADPDSDPDPTQVLHNILDSTCKFSGNKYSIAFQLVIMDGSGSMFVQALDAVAGPDPAKMTLILYIYRIRKRIHNTDLYTITI